MKELHGDPAIVGGGPAGICAALEAARLGLQTVLVHNRPVLGGNSSSEIRVWTRGAVGAGNLFSEEMGMLGLLKMRNLYANPNGNPVFWDEVLLDAALAQPGLTLLLNTHVTDLSARDGRVEWVQGSQQSSERTYRIRARMFLDATGDGTLGARAGVPYWVGDRLYDEKAPRRTQRPAGQFDSVLCEKRGPPGHLCGAGLCLRHENGGVPAGAGRPDHLRAAERQRLLVV